MKILTTFFAFAAVANALPAASPEAKLEVRATGSTANELSSGACRPVTFIFARGSTEPGNLGILVGPPTCDGLKSKLGANNVACQGVGGPYTAGLLDNVSGTGTTQAAIGEGNRLVNLAATKCPDTKIVLGGYSQGAALTHGVAKRLSSDLQSRVAGIITYGDSRNAEDKGTIPPFPASKYKIFCNQGDGVCGPALVVTAQHLDYMGSVGPAVSFLTSKVGGS